MKILKIVLILLLLFGLSFGVLGEGWRTLEIRPMDLMNYGDADTHDTLEMDITDYPLKQTDIDLSQYQEYVTLLGWFKDLSLDEKVAVYNWWKYESVNLKVVTEYGELFIRLDKN